ncbi:hypothetical protein PoB_002266800 [Plakobranchus ocellatus]|uniref:Uncharacterized protein n=1 Tax=Plakobranchus ocellatus TaxID=259542 RepID=A0AAV3ZNJ9_9GAST|nr:hypothetical protein PoB_002266800 [Plakobranchus ocellatus]
MGKALQPQVWISQLVSKLQVYFPTTPVVSQTPLIRQDSLGDAAYETRGCSNHEESKIEEPATCAAVLLLLFKRSLRSDSGESLAISPW